MTTANVVFLTTFLAAAVEAIEMVTIVVGVGATRGYRYTLLGAAGGLVVLAVVIAVGGLALAAIPIGPLRLAVGALLLLFGLQWYRKGIVRVATNGLAGFKGEAVDERPAGTTGVDWTAAFLAFKGVSLEGLEIAIIIVTFGASAQQLSASILGGLAALVLIAAIGAAVRPLVERIPRSFLQLLVGVLLTAFGTFWGLEGLNVKWPQNDFDIVLLAIFYTLGAGIYISFERRTRRRVVEVVRS